MTLFVVGVVSLSEEEAQLQVANRCTGGLEAKQGGVGTTDHHWCILPLCNIIIMEINALQLFDFIARPDARRSFGACRDFQQRDWLVNCQCQRPGGFHDLPACVMLPNSWGNTLANKPRFYQMHPFLHSYGYLPHDCGCQPLWPNYGRRSANSRSRRDVTITWIH